MSHEKPRCLDRQRVSKLLLPVAALACLTPWISPVVALLGGMIIALTMGNPYIDKTPKLTRWLLCLSIVGLGAGMNLTTVTKAGVEGISYTFVSISAALAIGLALGRFLRSDRETSILISVGTAICGGSAIAAIAPVIGAKHHAISVALGVVFLLNAVALLVFPAIGNFLDLDQAQFGLWCALAIHDTSSVVGASLLYGQEALQIGTTIKLVRALWIVPLALAIGAYLAHTSKSTENPKNLQKPWFILGFILVSAIFTWMPAAQGIGAIVEMAAKRILVLTLFLIGTGLTFASLRTVGMRPLFQGLLLWIVVLAASLMAVKFGLVS